MIATCHGLRLIPFFKSMGGFRLSSAVPAGFFASVMWEVVGAMLFVDVCVGGELFSRVFSDGFGLGVCT